MGKIDFVLGKGKKTKLNYSSVLAVKNIKETIPPAYVYIYCISWNFFYNEKRLKTSFEFMTLRKSVK